MRFDPAQLETIVVIVEEGSFDAAARRLHLSPSAVSQRVRALERAAGQVLLRRTTPAVATPAGEPLVRLGRRLRLLAAEAAQVLDDAGPVDLPVAVNADSLATWLRPVLGRLAEHGDLALRLHVEDQSLSHDLLRRGDVLAAVTSEPAPVQGCSVQPLGALSYVAMAAGPVLDRHRRGDRFDWAGAPVVVFNEKDRLQDEVLGAVGHPRPAVVHRVPSSADFLAAVRSGLGWGMVPLPQREDGDGLERLPDAAPVDVPLFWQRWRLDSAALDTLTREVVRAAGALG